MLGPSLRSRHAGHPWIHAVRAADGSASAASQYSRPAVTSSSVSASGPKTGICPGPMRTAAAPCSGTAGPSWGAARP